jgi:hypothetical protein
MSSERACEEAPRLDSSICRHARASASYSRKVRKRESNYVVRKPEDGFLFVLISLRSCAIIASMTDNLSLTLRGKGRHLNKQINSPHRRGYRFTSAVALSIALLFPGMANGQARVEFTDGTGTIRIRVKTCGWVQSHPDQRTGRQVTETSCGVDDDDNDGLFDWALVGGGAEICCASRATLNRSAPDTDNLWWASSSGNSSESHQIRAWAILMQLVDGIGQSFVPNVQITDDNFELCEPNTAGVCINRGIWSRAGGFGVLVGAGAQIQPEGQATGGLTESRPVIADTGEIVWRVGARLGPTDVSVRAWLVGMDLCPERWNGECLSSPIIKELISTATSGRNTVNGTIASSSIPTTIGGQAIAQGNAVRYLDDLIPLNGANRGVTVESKPGNVLNSGATLGSALVISRSAASPQGTPFTFESLSDWISTVPLSLNPNLKTQGASGLSVGGANYRTVTSVPMRTPIAGFGSRLLLDVYIPGQQPNPFWVGAVQIFASCPSGQMYNAFIGQVELTGRPTGAFSTLEFNIPASVRNVLSQRHDDCSFTIGVNMNATRINPVLDNLRFAP